MSSPAKKTWTVAELAAVCGARVVGDASRRVGSIAPLDQAGPEDVSFLADPKWEKHLAATRAGAVIVKNEVPGAAFAQIVAADPYLAYARVAGAIAEVLFPRPAAGVAPGAFVAGSAVLGEGCTVFPGASVGERARLGRNVVLHPGVAIGDDVVVGDDCTFFPNAVVYPRCRIGSRVRIHACTVIGNDGYGFAPTPDRKLVKIPQIGWAEIGDDVEIGPCCTIHRGALGPTRIGRGTKIDALVLVAHNVQVGEDVRLVGGAAIAGSSSVGDRAVIAGQVGVAGHLSIAADVVVAAQSGVAGNVDKPGIYWGTPIMPMGEAKRVIMTMPRLPEMRKELRDIAKRLDALEGKSDKQV
ncbi:MAG TPA: UDP-3-O-(3-hydroxymyristoyl)glucosamine N-acyltransferase [Planctomycetota bacterium]|nr:UDP-3-O-(3-hydroxymyristoyl)glucosamine N-acyltransferase [Planctomycetota bacterium]